MPIYANFEYDKKSIDHFFGFDIYFLIKGVRFSVWETKDL